MFSQARGEKDTVSKLRKGWYSEFPGQPCEIYSPTQYHEEALIHVLREIRNEDFMLDDM